MRDSIRNVTIGDETTARAELYGAYFAADAAFVRWQNAQREAPDHECLAAAAALARANSRHHAALVRVTAARLIAGAAACGLRPDACRRDPTHTCSEAAAVAAALGAPI